ncbi:hypothetical protein LCGC14_1761180 [marine sediment metagenome]|uniref:NapC/NirT cytochrome c N-terminal domain-containing protein n=1 Tax=marine sediment metagenome TaxID=412755 RepID=A0A0F9JFZ9_9ZZZZ
MSNRALTWISAIFAIALGSWFLLGEAVEMTSGVDFCGSCHSMQAAARSYLQDAHGSNNSGGGGATCTDCHLPQDSQLKHLVFKVHAGARDLWAELLTDTRQIDWHEKRRHRESFVYDSGCLKCHSNLEAATMANHKAYVGHRPYLLGQTRKVCVSCHSSVGHKDLGSFQ